MGAEECAKFLESSTGDSCQPDDLRIKDTLEKFDEDKDGFLTEEDFINLYKHSCVHRPKTVWKNLEIMGYGTIYYA